MLSMQRCPVKKMGDGNWVWLHGPFHNQESPCGCCVAWIDSWAAQVHTYITYWRVLLFLCFTTLYTTQSSLAMVYKRLIIYLNTLSFSHSICAYH